MKGSRFYVRILARKCTNKHTVTLYLRIKQEGVKGHILYSTGLKCLKKDFNPARQTVKDAGINELIQQERTRVYKSIFLLKEEFEETRICILFILMLGCSVLIK